MPRAGPGPLLRPGPDRNSNAQVVFVLLVTAVGTSLFEAAARFAQAPLQARPRTEDRSVSAIGASCETRRGARERRQVLRGFIGVEKGKAACDSWCLGEKCHESE